VYVMDDNGCIATNTVIVGSTLDVKDPGNGGMQLINLYPNPTKGDFTLQMTGIKNNQITICLYNTLGEAVSRHTYDIENGEINQSFHLSHKIAVGTYYLAIYDGNEKPVVIKFVRH